MKIRTCLNVYGVKKFPANISMNRLHSINIISENLVNKLKT